LKHWKIDGLAGGIGLAHEDDELAGGLKMLLDSHTRMTDWLVAFIETL